MFQNLKSGDTHTEVFEIDRDHIQKFAEATGDTNPIHFNDSAAKELGFKGAISHGLLAAASFSKVLGTTFPGHGTIYLGQTLSFKKPVYPGTTLKACLTVLSVSGRCLNIKTTLLDPAGDIVLDGEAQVLVPSRK